MKNVPGNISVAARAPLAAGGSLASRPMLAVLLAQFLSALGDNALLFAALAVLTRDHYRSWSVPVLQEFFVGAYIVLAPFAGPLADTLPKGRVMLLAASIGMLLILRRRGY